MKEDRYVSFKINTPAFLTEIVDNALGANKNGVLKIPLNVFRINLGLITQRCAQINDPILNKILCDMALYEQADPYSKEYDKKMIKQVESEYKKYLKTTKYNERH